VEDNPANVDLVEQILARRSHIDLYTAVDAPQGIAMARQHLPRVILMDLHLPGMSGMEALHILRQDAATMHIPVIAVSANAMPLDIVNGLSAGFFRYLTKPFQIDHFLEVLDLALALASKPEVQGPG
jgi:CheY-like chemotaxis protein